jgi:hypothetical protein
MDQIQFCLAQVLVDPHTLNIGKYGLIIIKNGVLKQLSKLFLVLRQVVQT